MLYKKGAAFIAGVVAATCFIAPAVAQNAPKDILPPGAQTIAGPGIVPGGLAAITVWESLVGVNVCVTGTTTAASANVSIRLQPANVARSFSLGANRAFSFCGADVTKVQMTGPNGSTFWRVDRF